MRGENGKQGDFIPSHPIPKYPRELIVLPTHWPERKKIGYDMQPKDRIPPYTLRHIYSCHVVG